VKRLIVCCGAVLGVALSCSASAPADPQILMSPNPAKTGPKNQVTFTPPADGSDYTWDLNGDGAYGDDALPPWQWAYDLPGTVNVGVRYTDAGGSPQEVVEPLVVDGLPANFVVFPDAPVPGEPVTLAYSPGPALPSPPEWDLNGDGVFPDATGPRATISFPSPGAFLIGLRVTDINDAVSTRFEPVTVVSPPASVTRAPKPQLGLMSPFPVVRITGKVTRKGARIKRLTVRAPYGSTIAVRCHGRSCPFHRSNRTLTLIGSTKTPAKTIRVRKLEHRLLRRGASIKVLVSKAGEIGKYTRFRIRGGRPPVRSDLCLTPGSTVPQECPSS
jgi:hypothetical protein